MTTLERLEIAVKEADRLGKLLMIEIRKSGYNSALKHIEDFVAIKSSYSIISHELLEFIRINRCQKSQSQSSEEE